MASVWVARLVRKHGFEKLVAIKTILPKYAEDETFQKMFLDEARIASRIDHANVAHIHDLGEEGDILYLVMEWIDGDALTRLRRAILKKGHPFPADIALRIMADVCAGLHAAHELRGNDGLPLGVVHRDVSPQNILINIEGVAKVIDFGVAKAAHRLVEETNTGFVKGKVQYMAPEQALGRVVDRRADCWAVGAVLYHLLANRPPFEADNQLAMLHVLTSGEPPTPLPSNIPTAVAEVVMRALTHDTSKRFQSTAEMRAAIERTGLTATTDDVSECLRTYLGDQAEARRHALAVALHTAGARAERDLQASSGGLSSPGVLVGGGSPSSERHPTSAVHPASTGSDSGTRPPLNPVVRPTPMGMRQAEPIPLPTDPTIERATRAASAKVGATAPQTEAFALTGPNIPAPQPAAAKQPPPVPPSSRNISAAPPVPSSTPRIGGAGGAPRPPPVPPPRASASGPSAPKPAAAVTAAPITTAGPFASPPPPPPPPPPPSDPLLGARVSATPLRQVSDADIKTTMPIGGLLPAIEGVTSAASRSGAGGGTPANPSGGFGDFTGVPAPPQQIDAAFGGLTAAEAMFEQKTELMVAPSLTQQPTEPITGGGGSLGLASISSSVATKLPPKKRRVGGVLIALAAVAVVGLVGSIGGFVIAPRFRSPAKFDPTFSPLPPAPPTTANANAQTSSTAAPTSTIVEPSSIVTAPAPPPSMTTDPPVATTTIAPPSPSPTPTHTHSTAATVPKTPVTAAPPPASAKKRKPDAPPPPPAPNDGF